MAKRFTDSEKWDDEWFLSLDNDSRIVWQFLLDKCSIGGCWKKNFQMLNFCCRLSWDEEMVVNTFNGRLIDRGTFFFIPKFVKFQYPKGLNSAKPAIIAVRNELIDKGLDLIIIKSFGNDYLTIKDKDKDKDTDKDTDKGSLIQTPNSTPWIDKSEHKTLRMLFNKEDDLVQHLQTRGFDLAGAKGLAVEILQGDAK
jgi:hypothetical protein